MCEDEYQQLIDEYITKVQDLRSKRKGEQGKWDEQLRDRLRKKCELGNDTTEDAIVNIIARDYQ